MRKQIIVTIIIVFIGFIILSVFQSNNQNEYYIKEKEMYIDFDSTKFNSEVMSVRFYKSYVIFWVKNIPREFRFVPRNNSYNPYFNTIISIGDTLIKEPYKSRVELRKNGKSHYYLIDKIE